MDLTSSVFLPAAADTAGLKTLIDSAMLSNAGVAHLVPSPPCGRPLLLRNELADSISTKTSIWAPTHDTSGQMYKPSYDDKTWQFALQLRSRAFMKPWWCFVLRKKSSWVIRHTKGFMVHLFRRMNVIMAPLDIDVSLWGRVFCSDTDTRGKMCGNQWIQSVGRNYLVYSLTAAAKDHLLWKKLRRKLHRKQRWWCVGFNGSKRVYSV